jgi:hypothetical protein
MPAENGYFCEKQHFTSSVIFGEATSGHIRYFTLWQANWFTFYGKPKGTPFLCSRRSTRSRRSTLFLQPEKKKKVFLKFLFFIFLAFILLISKFNKSINDQLEGFPCKLCPLLSIPLHLYLISYYLDLISKIVSSIQFQFEIQQVIMLHSFK